MSLAANIASPARSTRCGHLDHPDTKVGTAEQRMWAHYQHERATGRTLTGAELDRIAGTDNYGRVVLARWRRTPPYTEPGCMTSQ